MSVLGWLIGHRPDIFPVPDEDDDTLIPAGLTELGED